MLIFADFSSKALHTDPDYLLSGRVGGGSTYSSFGVPESLFWTSVYLKNKAIFKMACVNMSSSLCETVGRGRKPSLRMYTHISQNQLNHGKRIHDGDPSNQA